LKIAFSQGILNDADAVCIIAEYLGSLGLAAHVTTIDPERGKWLVAMDTKDFVLCGPIEAAGSKGIRYLVGILDIPNLSLNQAKELFAKLRVGKEFVEPKIFLEAYGEWKLMNDKEEVKDTERVKISFSGQTTVINNPRDTVIKDFQKTFITGNDTEKDKINNEILNLVKLVIDSKDLTDENKKDTTKALNSIADQIKEGKSDKLTLKGTLTAIQEVVSKAADIATPGIAIISTIVKLLGLI
jgi:hypothetical protein